MKIRTMKVHAISIAIMLAGVAGMATAGGENTLPPVTVSGAAISQCVPPDAMGGAACDAFDRMIRANFTQREIGMLFGARTSYPEYLTGGVDRLQRRYDALVRQYLAGQRPPGVASLASK